MAWMVSRAAQAQAAPDTADGEAATWAAGVNDLVDVAYSVGGGFMQNQMSISFSGLAALKQVEGYRAAPYKDQAGLWTGGYGHKLGFAEPKIERSEAEWSAVLVSDLTAAETAVNNLVTVPLTQGQFDALVMFVFNVGVGAFSRSTMLAKLNAGDSTAGNEFGRWVFVTQGGQKVVSQGLVNRRGVEAQLFKGSYA